MYSKPWRRALAKLLAPEAFQAETDLHAINSDVNDLWWWDVDGKVSLAVYWLINRRNWRKMSIEDSAKEVANKSWPHHPFRNTISDLRRWLESATEADVSLALKNARERITLYTIQ